MNGQPPVQPPRKEQPGRMGELLLQFLRLMLNNWHYKLLSIFLAVLLWTGLIMQDPTLTRERNFFDVNVSVIGEDTLKREGFIVLNDLSALLDDVMIRANVPQMQYQNAKASHYNVRVDLSRITHAGEQSLSIQTSNSSVYGSVAHVEPESVNITVDKYITRNRIPVRTRSTGVAPDGFLAAAPSVESSVVAISGPESIVGRIVCAEVVVDLAALPAREGMMRMALPFVLLDVNNEPVTSSLLNVTNQSMPIDSLNVSVNVYAAKTVPLMDLGLIKGTPKTGYEVKSVSIIPESVTIAGPSKSLEGQNMLAMDGVVDVSDCSESFHKVLRIAKSPEMEYISASTCTVMVEIGPVIQSRTFENVRMNIIEVGTGLTAELEEKYITATLTGPQLWISSLKASDVEAFCDATNLSEGAYELPVFLSIKNRGEQTYSVEVHPDHIPVKITKKE